MTFPFFKKQKTNAVPIQNKSMDYDKMPHLADEENQCL
jgi:hypothetical protein